MTSKKILLALALVTSTTLVSAQTGELNLYSARHYATDEALYANFTASTGIKINRIEVDDAGLVARLKSEGAASPADVLLFVDAARLHRAETEGLFLPIKSAVLTSAIPPSLRSKPAADGGTNWFGFSKRARVIVYDKTRVAATDVDSYEKLADPINKGKICMRSASHPYNLSLFGAVTEHLGEAKAEAWMKGLRANLARDPKGGDTDQIKGVASGECAIAITNSYYVARLMRSDKLEDKAVVDKVTVMFPNQASYGTHLNIAGGGVAKDSKNTANATKFMEYLASSSAQNYFANGNNEWPTANGVVVDNPALRVMSPNGFKSETIHITAVSVNQPKVQHMLDRVGLK